MSILSIDSMEWYSICIETAPMDEELVICPLIFELVSCYIDP